MMTLCSVPVQRDFRPSFYSQVICDVSYFGLAKGTLELFGCVTAASIYQMSADAAWADTETVNRWILRCPDFLRHRMGTDYVCLLLSARLSGQQTENSRIILLIRANSHEVSQNIIDYWFGHTELLKMYYSWHFSSDRASVMDFTTIFLEALC